MREKGNCLGIHSVDLFPSFFLCCRATLTDGREVCLEPNAPWVRLIIKAILDKWVICSQWAWLIKKLYFKWASKHVQHKAFKNSVSSHSYYRLCSLTGTNTVIALSFNYNIRFNPLLCHTPHVNVSYTSRKAQVYWKPAAQVLRKSRH